ncbi:MAG: hypothetical protein KC609_17315, partial [Myxococcales bacterium]|nr:hypothetical protein [Myxococcales bacterium]
RAEGRALDPVTAAREELQRTDEAKLRPAPLVDGHDLIRLGVPKGSIYKEILQQLEEHQLEESITTREEALAFVRRLTGGA